MKYVAYYRVSTTRQGESGLGLEAQRAACLAHVRDNPIVGEYTDIESGKNNRRPELAKALSHARIENAVLIIAKLDRLSRNVAFVSSLMESGVEFVACDNPHANKMTIQLLAVFAEHERDMISKRTKEALRAAKARGVKLGNPNPSGLVEAAVEGLKRHADDFAWNIFPLIKEAREKGYTTLEAIAKELNHAGHTTRRGKRFTPTSVKRIIERCEA